MIAQSAAEDYFVARLRPSGRQVNWRVDDSDSCRSDKNFVSATLLHNFGIPSHYGDICLRRGCSHRVKDSLQRIDRKPFFKNETGGEIEWTRSANRQVVDCTVNREFADVTARKKYRRHDIGVGGKSESSWAE